MRKLLVPLLIACLLPAPLHAALRERDDVNLQDAFNPAPAPDDLVLPMPCGGSMVFKAIGTRSKGLLWDMETTFGSRTIDPDQRGYYDSPRSGAIAGPFLLRDLPPDWQKKLAAIPDAASMQFYFMGKYEVSQRQWDAVMGGQCVQEQLPPPTEADLRPLTGIAWQEAQSFAQRYTEWLLANAPDALPTFQGDTKNTAFMRLPTEAEWEYAARGGQNVAPLALNQEEFILGDGESLKDYAVFRDGGTAGETLRRIGSLKPNPAGLYDTAGNAAEMTQDAFQFSLGGRLHGSSGGFVRKGGSFLSAEDEIMPGRREEVAPFLRDGPNRIADLGLRLTLSGINTPSGARPGELADAWRKAGQELSAELNPSGDPLELIAQLMGRTADETEKKGLQSLQGLIRENNITLERQKRAAVGNEIRSAAYLVTMLKDCLIKREIIAKERTQFEEKRKQITAALPGLNTAEAARYQQVLTSLDKGIRLAQSGLESQDAEFRSMLLFYKQTLENGKKIPQTLFDEQMQAVTQEMSGKAPHLVKQSQSLKLYRKHMELQRAGKLALLASDTLRQEVYALIRK